MRIRAVVAAALAAAIGGIGVRGAETVPAPIRVVSQTVGTDEMLLALADPGQIAALSQLAADPEFSAVAALAAAYPRLEANGDAESVLQYRPTLVLCADYSRPELVAQLRRAGVPVMIFAEYTSMDAAYANLRLLARALGAEARAERLIAGCQSRMDRLSQALRGVRPARVIAPSIYGVIPGADTTFQDMCDHAGAINLASTLGHLRGHAPPPVEQMLSWPVDWVVLGGSNARDALAPFRQLSPYEYMDAVKSGRVALLKPYLLSCVSFHRIDGYEALARALHPGAFR